MISIDFKILLLLMNKSFLKNILTSHKLLKYLYMHADISETNICLMYKVKKYLEL